MRPSLLLISLLAAAMLTASTALAQDESPSQKWKCADYLALKERTRNHVTGDFLFVYLREKQKAEELPFLRAGRLIAMNSKLREMLDARCLKDPKVSFPDVIAPLFKLADDAADTQQQFPSADNPPQGAS